MTSSRTGTAPPVRRSVRTTRTEPGAVLADRFVLCSLLGSGGMGEVWEARDLALGRRVAVKLPWADDPAEAERFQREARIAAGISHPGVTSVFDVGLDAWRPFIVMELIDGPTLGMVLEGDGLGAGDAARVGAGIASALAALHARGIVHGDVKPDNIVIAADGRPKLTDLGIASLAREDEAGSHRNERYGTVPFIAPEVARGGRPTAASDVFALGRTLRTVLGPGTDDEDTGPLRDVLRSATHPDPSARPDAETLAAALGALVTTTDRTGAVVTSLAGAAVMSLGPRVVTDRIQGRPGTTRLGARPATTRLGARPATTRLGAGPPTTRLASDDASEVRDAAPLPEVRGRRVPSRRGSILALVCAVVLASLAIAVFAAGRSVRPSDVRRSPAPAIVRTTAPAPVASVPAAGTQADNEHGRDDGNGHGGGHGPGGSGQGHGRGKGHHHGED